MSSTTQASAVPTGTWTLDPTHSTGGVTVTYMGVAPFKGAFREFQATPDAEGPRGSPKASSTDVDNEQLAEHLASPDFFETATYPELSFEAGAPTRDDDTVTFEGVLEVKRNKAPHTLHR